MHAFENDSIEDVARIMSEHPIRRLPVGNRQKCLVGIVSPGDFALKTPNLLAGDATPSEISATT